MKKIGISLILFSFIFASNSLFCMKKTVEIEEKQKKTVVEKVFNKKSVRKKFKVGTIDRKVQKIRDALENDNNAPLIKLIKEWLKNKKALQKKETEIAPLEKSRKRWCCTCLACCILPMFYYGVPIIKECAPVIKDFIADYPLYMIDKLFGRLE